MNGSLSKAHLAWFLLIQFLLLAAAALVYFRPERPELQPPASARVAVTVLAVEPQRFEDRITLPGRALPFEDVTVAAEQAGRIVALHAREGLVVGQGDPLLQVDASLWETAERNTVLRLEDARRALDRAREMHARGAMAQRDLESAQTAAESAEISLAEVRIQRERCLPLAPMDGVVETRYVSAGEYVHPGQPLLRILDTARIKVDFDLPERDVHALGSGDACVIRFDALPGQVHTGVVAVVAAGANPGNNAFAVEVHLDNPQGAIRPGMMARVDVVRATIEHAVLLPLFAVVPMEGETVVYVVEDDRAVRRIVRIGSISDSRALIRTGVHAGDRVILDGNRQVLDGTPVRIVSDWAPAPLLAVNAPPK